MQNIKIITPKYNIYISIFLIAFITIICQAHSNKTVVIHTDTGKSSITIELQPKQELSLVSDFEILYTFKNEDDTIKKISEYFSFNKIKEFRTLTFPLPQILLLFPESNIEFSLINGKLVSKNNEAKQSLISDYIQDIGFDYCLRVKEKHDKLDSSSHNSFLLNHERKLNNDLEKIQLLVKDGFLDADKASYWKLLCEMTHASLVFNSIDYSWLNVHRKDLYDHYCDELQEINQISGETTTLTIENLSWYFGKLNQKDSLSWVDFYLNNKYKLGNVTIGNAFYSYLKNASNKNKKTKIYQENLQKISRYANQNDSILNNLIVWKTTKTITNLKGIVLQNKLGVFEDLESIFRKTNKKYILLDFWASWCKPCRIQLPYLKKLKYNLSKNNIGDYSCKHRKR